MEISTVPRRLFFAAQQRIAITWKPKYCNIKKSAVQRGENISKKKGEMSSNFGEIIKKLYFLVWSARGLPTPLPHLSPRSYRTFLRVVDSKCKPQVRDLLARITRGRGGGGRGDLRNGAIR
jgi:hypothetical protein